MIDMPKGLLSKTLYTDFYLISSYRSNEIIHKSFMKFELVILNFKVVNRGVGLTTTIIYRTLYSDFQLKSSIQLVTLVVN